MRKKETSGYWSPAAIGILSGLLVFGALKAVEAYQQAFTIPQIASDPEKFYGKEVTLTGLARSGRTTDHYVGGGQYIKVFSFTIYEPSGDEKYPYGRRSVMVTQPLAKFMNLPRDGAPVTITGVLKEPSLVGTIDP